MSLVENHPCTRVVSCKFLRETCPTGLHYPARLRQPMIQYNISHALDHPPVVRARRKYQPARLPPTNTRVVSNESTSVSRACKTREAIRCNPHNFAQPFGFDPSVARPIGRFPEDRTPWCASCKRGSMPERMLFNRLGSCTPLLPLSLLQHCLLFSVRRCISPLVQLLMKICTCFQLIACIQHRQCCSDLSANLVLFTENCVVVFPCYGMTASNVGLYVLVISKLAQAAM